MKKIGRGASYQKALLANLERSLLTHKKIQTTRSRGKRLMARLSRKKDIIATAKSAPSRRGDNAPQVTIELAIPDQKPKPEGKKPKSA